MPEEETKKIGIFEKLTKRIFKPAQEKLPDKSASRTAKEVDKHDIESVPYLGFEPFNNYVSEFITKDYDSLAQTLNTNILECRKLAENPIIEQAVSDITQEAIVQDEFTPTLSLNLDALDMTDQLKSKIINEFEYILDMMEFEIEAESLFKQFYIDGQLALLPTFDNNRLTDGIKQITVMTPYNLFEFTVPETGEKYYFYNNEIKPDATMAENFKNAQEVFNAEEVARTVSGIWSQDRAVPISYLTRAQKVSNQLGLLEDAMIIFRITRAPDRRVFYIHTGRLPKSKAEEYIKNLITKYRQKKIYNQQTGLIQNQPTTMALESDYWLPVGENEKGTRIENLAGQHPDMGNLEDVKYFQKKLFQVLKVPVNRLDHEAKMVIGNTIDIEREEITFTKFCKGLRLRFGDVFLQLLRIQLVAKKIISDSDWSRMKNKIKLVFNDNNEYADIKHLQKIEQKMEAAAQCTPFIDGGLLSREYIFKEVFQFTDEEIAEMEKQIAKDRKNKQLMEPVMNLAQASIGTAISGREEGGETPDEGDSQEGEEENRFT